MKGYSIQLHTLTIGTEQFPLRLGVDLPRFKRRLMRASRHGGGMLDIPTDGDDRITAVVTRGVPMTFRSRELPPESDPDDLTFPEMVDHLREV